MKNNCYPAKKGLDDVIAKQVDGWTPALVANLRGMWEERNPGQTITVDNYQSLVDFKKSLSDADNNKLIATMKGTRRAADAIVYRQLREAFSAEDRFNRVNMISTIFTDIVDAAQEANPNMSREDIIKKGGVSNIFANIHETLNEQYSEAVNEGDTELADKYQKIFDNWDALIYAAKIRIKMIENVKLGQDVDFSDNANPNNYNDNDMTFKFIMEESKREGWMEQAEFQSAFGSIGAEVRKVIGRLPQFEKGDVKLDDLGFPVMQDPVRVHQELLDVLRGMSTESQMLELLNQYSATSPWVSPLLAELELPAVRTQFFVDFKKNFQLYSMQTEQKDGRLSKFKTAILNKIKGDKPFSAFMTSVKMGKIVNPVRSVFEKTETGTRVLPARLDRIKTRIIDTLAQDPNNITSKPKFWTMSRVERKEFLIDATESLNMDIDGETLDKLLARPSELRKFNKVLLEAAQFGLNLTNEEQAGNKTVSYEELIKKASSNEKKGVLREKVTKMLAISSKFKEGLKMDARVRHGDNTMYSNVIPSFMGDRMDLIGTFARTANIKGLQEFLGNNYLTSSYFMSGGKIRNKWIEELYNSDLSNEDNFAANFQYKRGLSLDDLDFEDFTAKQHLLYLMNEYFSEKQISSKSQYAWYPVFILGDSGVAKFIKAKRYSFDEIVDGLYNTYVQEVTRMKMTQAVRDKMRGEGYKAIDNFDRNGDKFSLLTFLNEPRYAEMINPNNLEQSVKKAINAYLREGVSEFTDKVDRLGLLAKSGSEYTYLNQEVKGDRTVDRVLADYWCNTKFATIQQLQMMTVDPSFYAGTKDLQKRYKEIHAPGSSVSIEAIDPYTGKRFSSDGIERVVYFDDINVNAEKVDPKFMKAIANHFGKDSNTYKAYLKNTLTDGQGYRTLESYRKVMGMAGKWTPDMQNAYEQIQAIRARIGDSNITPEDIKSLSDVAVVFQPIKPYLFSFENYSINGNDVLKIPVQHKYAEAVLIPELLPAGSQLRDMAHYMEENDIDMVGSTKIVKVGGFGSAKISEARNKEALTNALSKGYVHQLAYADYRIQTNVPEHINSSQLFGTQVRKLIMAKINMAKNYASYIGGKKVNLGGKQGMVNLNGYNLVRFYNSLIVSNILESYDKFAGAIASPEGVSNRLIQTTANNDRESKDNILSYAIDEFGEITMPLFEGGLEHDSSALMFSLFKKMVNKQAIKGGSAVQVSAMGITGYEEDGGLQYVTDDNNNILYAECEMPWDLNYTDASGNVHQLDYNDWCNTDGTLKTDKSGNPLIEKTYPNILSLLAYRIPTERDYSMINLKIKRFSHKTAGGTIKVPPQGTTIAGFDFDIDKLYLMLNEFKYKDLDEKQIEKAWKDFYSENPDLYKELKALRATDESLGDLVSSLLGVESGLNRLYKYKEGVTEQFQEWLSSRVQKYSELESYDFDKSPLDNTRASRNNMLIQLIQQRLSDPETFGDRYTPGGFTNASNAARTMRVLEFMDEEDLMTDGRIDMDKVKAITKAIEEEKIEDPEPDYDPSDPMTIVTYNQQNQVAGKLIGIFANQNTNHAFASLMKKFELKRPITFAGKSFRDLLKGPEGVDTSLSVAELLAASVDAVKDPVLNFLNLNTITADAGAMLARLGYSMEDIGLLFNQPIIKDICEYSFNNGMSDINSVIQNVLDNMYEVKGEERKTIPDVDFTAERLAYNIVENRAVPRDEMTESKLEDFKQRQRQIAALFKEIIEASNDVSEFVRNTKFTASNAVGSTFGDAIAQQMKVAKYIKAFQGKDKLKVNIMVGDDIITPINNDKTLELSNADYLDGSLTNPFSYEQAMYDMNRKAFNLMNKYFPYNTSAYRRGRETLASLTKGGLLDDKTINSIHSDMLVYMLNHQENSMFNGNTPIRIGNSVSSYTGNITPDENTIFVFGSNPEGRHGAGAAKVAREQFGAIYSQGEGLQGNSYALPTKDLRVTENKGLRSISPEQIIRSIRKMYETARANPDKQFKVAYRNSLEATTLNGYTGSEMIDMFVKAGNIPSNVVFSEEWARSGKFGKTETVTARDYFTKIFPAELFRMLESNPTMKSLPIFQYLQFQTDEKTGEMSMNVDNVGGLAPYQKDEIKESWAEIAKNESTSDVAISMFMYNFYKLGFAFSNQSFMNLAPTELKQRVPVGVDYNGNPRSYVDFLDDVKAEKIGFNDQKFAQQYILNHLDNNRLVFTPKGKSAKIINGLVYAGDIVKSSFVFDAKKWGQDASPFLLNGEEGVTTFRPVIMVGDDVYMCESGGPVFNVSESGSITYHRVDRLGTTGQSLQYVSNAQSTEVDMTNRSVQVEGSTSIEPEVTEATSGTPSVEELINEALSLYQVIEPEADVDMAMKVLRNAAAENANEFQAFIEELRTRVKQLRDAENKPIC